MQSHSGCSTPWILPYLLEYELTAQCPKIEIDTNCAPAPLDLEPAVNNRWKPCSVVRVMGAHGGVPEVPGDPPSQSFIF